jgi:PDZ domain
MEGNLAIGSHMRFSLWLLTIMVAAVLPSAPAIADENAISSYESQGSAGIDPHLRSLDEYTRDSILEISLLGIQLRQDQRELKSGAAAKGLLIVDVAKGSPADNAGLNALQDGPKQVLTGLAAAGSMMFPPAMVLLPIIPLLPIGHDGDLIIAVDGTRVANLLDFEYATHDAQPGEIIYLTIVRAGARMQIAVHIPAMENREENRKHGIPSNYSQK